MAYKKFVKKAKSFNKKYKPYLDKADKALKVAYAVSRLINVEYKESDDNISNTVSSDSPTIDSTITSQIVQGDTKANRQGNSIKVTSIHAKFKMVHNAAAAFNFCRVMGIIDKQCNGADPVIGDILDSTGTSILAYRNTDNSSRFIILFDKLLKTNNNGIQNAYFRYDKKFKKGFHIKYDASAGAITDVTSNSFFFLLVSDQLAAGSPPTLTASFRMRFVDN